MPDQQDDAPIILGTISAKEVSFNTDQNVIVVTEDKLRIQLIQEQHTAQARGAWVAPLGIALALLLTLLTSDFHKKMGLNAAVWEAIFIISLVISLGWLARTIYKRPKKGTIEDFIQELKNSEP